MQGRIYILPLIRCNETSGIKVILSTYIDTQKFYIFISLLYLSTHSSIIYEN